MGRPYRAEDDRAPNASQGDSDPLAELARLIGQTDPFANLGRAGREAPAVPASRRADISDTQNQYDSDQHASDPYASDQYAAGHDEPDDTTSAQDRSDHETSDDDAPLDVTPTRPSWMQRVAQRDAPQSYEDPVQATKSYSERTSGAQSYREPSFREPAQREPASRDQLSRDQSYREPSFSAPSPVDAYPTAPHDPHYQDPRYQEPQYDEPQHEAAYAQPHAGHGQQADPSRYDDALYGVADDGQPYDQHAVYPEDAYAQQGYEEEAAERAKPKRGGMMTVVVVAALAVVGTAAAYGYRSWTGSPRSGEAPIIKADPGPNKVVPQTADSSSKPIQDRVATGPGAERIVSREEQPVDPNTVKTSPRVVFPPLTQNPSPNPGGVATPVMPATRQVTNGAASGNLGGDEPRRVSTLRIRPDEANAAPTARAPAAAAPPPAARAPAPVTTATTPPANAPMSLSPQGSPAQTRTASNAPAAAALASTGGGYVVQISSQRSEADAQASYRALQGKFPSVLGSRTPLIKRADLGDKGIYYRAMVGPFTSPDEASQFCGSLKTAGGQCVVQRN